MPRTILRLALLVSLVMAVTSPLGSMPALAGPFPDLLDPPTGSSLGPVVLEHPEIYNIYLDGSWDEDNPAAISKENIDAFTQGLVDSDYFNAASQYEVTSPSFTGSDEEEGVFPCLLPSPGGVVGLLELSFWLACEFGPTLPGGPTLAGFDPPNNNSLYVVYLPQDMTLAEHPCSGIHYWSVTTVIGVIEIPLPPFELPDPHSQTFAFAVIPAECAASKAKPFEAITKAASHEIIEASTDVLVPGPGVPFAAGWINRDLDPIQQLITGEASDICEQIDDAPFPTPPVRLANGYLVSPYWSNFNHTCVPIGVSVKLKETGLPASVPHTATVNGNTVDLPYEDNFELGSALSFSYPSPVSDPNPGIRYVTDNLGQPPTSLMNPVDDEATYTRQFFLTTSTDPPFLAGIDPSLTPSGWHDDGEVVSLDTTSPIETGPGTRYRFDHWSGDVSSLAKQTNVTITAPTTAVANYELQYLLTVQTSGLGANLTHISNSSGVLGTANDTTPLVVWIDADTGGTLTADSNVNGAGGIQYFFQEFVPPPPATLTSPFTTTAVYKTMTQLIDEALTSGGITGPSAQGFAKALKKEFDAVQHDMATANYAAALGDLKSFINSVQSQCCTPTPGMEITSALATTLQLDALLVYHNALCLAISAGQISATKAANDYAYYSDLETSLGGTVLAPC